jgi:hypothetical protein
MLISKVEARAVFRPAADVTHGEEDAGAGRMVDEEADAGLGMRRRFKV